MVLEPINVRFVRIDALRLWEISFWRPLYQFHTNFKKDILSLGRSERNT